MAIRTHSDVEALEATPLADRALPENTYAALRASAERTPDAKALSFFLSADHFDRPHVWTYAELLADVTRAANAFHALGVTPEHSIAFALPNLPETHFTIWGGEAAGVVLAINPMLEPKQIAHLLRIARVRVLVTLAPALSAKLWPGVSAELSTLPDLNVVAFVDMAAYLSDSDAANALRSVDEARAVAPGLHVAARRNARSALTVLSRRERSKAATRHPTSAPAARPDSRRSRFVHMAAKSSTPSPSRR
jgi:fatty-acyl-CoA synthase